MKEFMIGTLADTPLEKVMRDGVTYFVDRAKKKVFEDKEGLPRVKDKKIIEKALA